MKAHIISLVSVSLAACATTGITPDGSSTEGMKAHFEARPAVAGDDATPWFPALTSEAALPRAGRLDREIAATTDRLRLGVRLCVSPDGSVKSIRVVQPSRIEAFDRAALADLQDWHYESFTAPATVEACKQMTVIYEPNVDRGHLGIRLVRVGTR